MTTPLSGTICHPQAGTCYDQHVHQIWSLQLLPFERYLRRAKNLKWVAWRDHAHFRDGLSSVGWDLLGSIHIPNLKCLRLPATKKWKATPNVKILVLSHPLENLGVMHRVHLWLDGKRIVDFPLAIIELFFASSHGCRNWRFLKGWVTLSANFR